MKEYTYAGDGDLAAGGIFIDLSTYTDGYCDAVKVTDLDSGCGFTGGILIEHLVIITDNKDQTLKALGCCDQTPKDIMQISGYKNKRMAITECLANYGYYDNNDAWNGYATPSTEILQGNSDGEMEYDGWKADKRVLDNNLAGYVKSVHLKG